jgi:hypothetical protein
MLVHDCGLRLGLHAKRLFDAVGRYSRDDVLGEPAPAHAGDDSRAISRETAPLEASIRFRPSVPLPD